MKQWGAIDDFPDFDLDSFKLHLNSFCYFLSYPRLLTIHNLFPVWLFESLQDPKGLDRLILKIQFQIVDGLHIQRLHPIRYNRISTNNPFPALFPNEMPVIVLKLPVFAITAERIVAKVDKPIGLFFRFDHVSIYMIAQSIEVLKILVADMHA